jgi:hypothetical protein
MVSQCEGIGADRMGRLSRLAVGVHTHPAEIVAEVRLHHVACRRGKRLAR